MTIFGDRVFKEVIKVKGDYECGPWDYLIGILMRRADEDRHTQKKEQRKTLEEQSHLQARGALKRNQHWGHLDLGLLASRTGRK